MIYTGDCVEVMASMDEASVDAIVCDPPYGIRFMGKAWDGAAIEEAARKRQAKRDASERVYIRKDTGKPYSKATTYSDLAMNAGEYDFSIKGNTAFQHWCCEWATAALRVAKPGAYLLAFGGTRTVHRLTVALEDAGWIIRDVLCWVYASGFPKSKASLKPAWEPIVLARKPGPLRELGIDAARIGTAPPSVPQPAFGTGHIYGMKTGEGRNGEMSSAPARWPANVVLTDPAFDGGWDGVVGAGPTKGGGATLGRFDSTSGFGGGLITTDYDDEGTYSRFFLVPKASRSDREPLLPGELEERGDDFGTTVRNARCQSCGKVRFAADDDRCHCAAPNWEASSKRRNTHPTVKPVELMRHLVRLVCPPGSTVLDPFLGSGTTAIACEAEGREWIGIEREPEYVRIAEQRLVACQRGLGLVG